MRGAIVAVAACVALASVFLAGAAEGAAPLCNWEGYYVAWCGSGYNCPEGQSCKLAQSFWCGNQQPADEPHCTAQPCLACDGNDAANTFSNCTRPGGAEECGPSREGNGIDENWSGCADEGCTKGEPPCACEKTCKTNVCSPVPLADCEVRKDVPEICANGEDENCNGEVDERCSLGWGPAGGGGGGGGPPNPDPPMCKDTSGTAGSDPILLATRSAMTEPFTDFAVEGMVRLSLTRTYTSADASIVAGAAPGIFGRGWHHGWEAELSCSAGVCTVTQGIDAGFRFAFSETAVSLDGLETWNVYRPYAASLSPRHGGILAERPNGDFVLFLPNGRELHFRTVCDACAGGEAQDPHCAAVGAGGKARLVKVVDGQGNATHLAYDRRGGTLLTVGDDLGRSLQVESADACGTGLASELRYAGTTVATYQYGANLELLAARDAEGRVLRGYAYEPGGWLLLAVLDEAGAAIAEFSYD
ncbi:MAG TPA: DUF6531 domain-containing protein, partial [Anaeromyxobacteraceae bacterium]|nr:DUF6531 domain-containing protein [Anaeromyxobacteraceae bacterium]